MLGTGAFAQSPSEQPRTNTPPAGQSHTNSNSSAPAAASPTASSPSSTPSAQNAQSTPSGTPKSATTTSRSAPTTTGNNDSSRSQAVGTVVPRDVRFQPLPPDVVEVMPQYRGYNFFVVRNDIAIVDPSS